MMIPWWYRQTLKVMPSVAYLCSMLFYGHSPDLYSLHGDASFLSFIPDDTGPLGWRARLVAVIAPYTNDTCDVYKWIEKEKCQFPQQSTLKFLDKPSKGCDPHFKKLAHV